jgi:hypothetical protein
MDCCVNSHLLFAVYRWFDLLINLLLDLRAEARQQRYGVLRFVHGTILLLLRLW